VKRPRQRLITRGRIIAYPTRAVSSAPAELPPDFAFGVCPALFWLPSLVAYVGWPLGV
jgi:hypothetical protein